MQMTDSAARLTAGVTESAVTSAKRVVDLGRPESGKLAARWREQGIELDLAAEVACLLEAVAIAEAGRPPADCQTDEGAWVTSTPQEWSPPFGRGSRSFALGVLVAAVMSFATVFVGA